MWHIYKSKAFSNQNFYNYDNSQWLIAFKTLESINKKISTAGIKLTVLILLADILYISLLFGVPFYFIIQECTKQAVNSLKDQSKNSFFNLL